MGILRQLLKALKLLVFENIYTRKINIRNNKAIFSFTFDDVPISAAKNGAKILEEFNITGTYYVALGMEEIDGSTDDNTRRFLNKNDIINLHNAGHDIGCHTYSHLNQRQHTSKTVLTNCNKNTNLLQNILNTSSIDNFSYPFGMVSPLGKKILGRKYKTLRTSDHGINSGVTDMTHLRAIMLYSNTFNRDTLTKEINLAIKEKAWLIFYTHDVCEQPSEWGVNTDDFKWLVEQCVISECDILNISNAYNKIINSHS